MSDIIEELSQEELLDGDCIKDIMDDIINTGTVDRGMVLTIESRLGANVIPAKIANSVSAVRSRHGAYELIDCVQNKVKYSKPVDVTDIINKVVNALRSLSKADLNAGYDNIVTELDKVNKMYVPRKLLDECGGHYKVLGEIPVSLLVKDGIATPYYKDAGIRCVKQFSSKEAGVAFGTLSVIRSLCVHTDVIIDDSNTYINYPGTVAEYLGEYLSVVYELKDHDIKEAFVRVTSSLDNASRSLFELLVCGITDERLSKLNQVLIQDDFITKA